MAIVLNDGFLLEGDAATAAKIDYVVSGLDGTSLKLLVSGQLPDAKATLYTAAGVDTIASITLYNTHNAGLAVNLYVNDGSSRKVLGIGSLGAGYHALFDGSKLAVYDENGSQQIETTAIAHASDHTDGTDDIQDATAAQKGLMTAAYGTKVDGIEALADVTDATNVAAAGAVMDADFTAADEVMVGTGAGTHGQVTLAASQFLAKKAAGAATNVTAAEARTILNVADGANAYVHPNHSGEVTSVADGAQTITNDAVTYAKMQNVSATDKVLGRATAGAGDVEEIACTAFARSILDDANEATFKATVNLEIGTDVLAQQTIGIADDNLVEIDDADAAANDIAQFTANGLQGLSYAELLAAIFSVDLPENLSLTLDDALSADGKWCGICEDGVAGTALAFGDLAYFAVADSRWELADADAEATAFGKLGICILAAADTAATKVLLYGKVRADTAFPALTVGAPVFVGTTAGDVQTTAPSGAADIVRVVGYGNTADELFFCPSPVWIEIVT